MIGPWRNHQTRVGTGFEAGKVDKFVEFSG